MTIEFPSSQDCGGDLYSGLWIAIQNFLSILFIARMNWNNEANNVSNNIISFPELSYIHHINLLERVQRSYTKRIPGCSRLSYLERLSLLNLHTLE